MPPTKKLIWRFFTALVAFLAVLLSLYLSHPKIQRLFKYPPPSLPPTMAFKSASGTMRAIVAHTTGPASVLTFHPTWPKPVPSPGQVLIRVHAFGLNRAEMFTRQGHSPGVAFPRILGIEAAGVVEAAPSGEFSPGERVVTAMGDMGRMYDGGYAEYTVVKASQVLRVKSGVEWGVLGALPETMQTAWGSLFGPLKLESGDLLLIRGGTTTIGLAAAGLAKEAGAYVVSTTRKREREELLRESGADEVIVDGGNIAEEAGKRFPEGFDKVLELVGTVSVADSLKTVKKGGICCMVGIVGGEWVLKEFSPQVVIPKGRYLTVYGGSSDDLKATPIDDIARKMEQGKIKLPIKTFAMEDIVQAHEFIEFEGGAKAVVLIS